MSLSSEQWRFLLDIASLIDYAYANGYKLTGGELYRTVYQQKEYLRQGLTKTSNSKHLSRLAIDFNIFYRSSIRPYTVEDFKNGSASDLGEFWRSLDQQHNVSGFDWGWDFGHFERQV